MNVLKMRTRTFRGAGVLALECGVLETAWLFGDKDQLIGCSLEQKGFRSNGMQACGHHAQGVINWLVGDARESTAIPN